MSAAFRQLILRYPAISPANRYHVCGYVQTLSQQSQFFSNSSTSKSKPQSARSKFKEILVNPSILKHIQNVGVGIPKRYDKKKRRRGVRRQRKDGVVLDRAEEMERFGRARRIPNTAPPPPFVAPNDSSEGSAKDIIRYPVKLIGSVGLHGDDEFPRASKGLPEVALAGRSNVGKSTLLNALLYGKHKTKRELEAETPPKRRRGPTGQTAKLPPGLKAVTSAKPGETRRVSFYQLSARVDSHKLSMLLVDLPGYGFAYASEEQANQYKSLMESYILDRGSPLKRLLLLVDARHGMKAADVEFLESLQHTIYERNAASGQKKRGLPPIQIVLTKCDLVPQTDIARRVTTVRQQLSDSLKRESGNLSVLMVSAQMEGQAGVLEVQKELASLIPEPQAVKNNTSTPERKRRV